ncbi:MAG: hypothetical protein FWD46_02810 [Cystobacterineae bacterium]|nr:hypothetical protein [Cystobacterineae bacterium]
MKINWLKMSSNNTLPSNPLPENLSHQPSWIKWTLAILAVIFAFLLHLHHEMVLSPSSDTATLIQEGRDALMQATLFPDFYMPNELQTMPTFFPTMLYGGLYLVTGNSGITLFLAGVISFVGLFIAFLYLLKPLNVETPYGLLAFSLLFPFRDTFYYWQLAVTAFMFIGLYVRLEKGPLNTFGRILRCLLPLIAFSQGFASLRLACTLYLPLAVAMLLSQMKISHVRNPLNPLK